MRRLSQVGAVLLVAGLLASLAGCAPTRGDLLRGSAAPRLACTQVVDYGVSMVTAALTNTGNEPVTVTDAMALRANNLAVDGIRIGRIRAALPDVSSNTNLFYTGGYEELYPAGVVVPAHATYQLVALVHVRDHTQPGSLSAFEVTYKQGWGTYTATTRVGYELSSRLDACSNDAQ